MKRLTRRDALKLTGGAALTVGLAKPSILRAQEAFPTRPINVVVPFDTGGYNDRLARAFSPFLQEQLGQPLIIVNRPGAGAMLGHTYFLQQPDDGYTILCTSAAPYIPLNILIQDAPFKVEDFWMINLPSRDYTLMATSAGSDIQSVDDAIARLKQDPGSLSIGVQPASADYVNLMLLLEAAGIPRENLRIVTYDGGGPARNATAGGVVDVGFVGGEGFLPLREQIRPLLVFDAERKEAFDAPSTTEFNQQQSVTIEPVAGSQRGWAVHSTLREKHPDRYEILLRAIEAASKDPDAIAALEAQELATTWYGPEESNEAYRRTFEVMQRHVDLLKAS